MAEICVTSVGINKTSETANVKIGHIVLHKQRLTRNNFKFTVNTNISLQKLLKTLSRATDPIQSRSSFPCVIGQALAKRSQQANATYRNIVERNMFRAFGHSVAKCCDVLGIVG